MIAGRLRDIAVILRRKGVVNGKPSAINVLKEMIIPKVGWLTRQPEITEIKNRFLAGLRIW